MKTTFLPALLGAGCALAASATLGAPAHADSVVTINPDGSVAQVESAQSATQQTWSNSSYAGDSYEGNAYAGNATGAPYGSNARNSRVTPNPYDSFGGAANTRSGVRTPNRAPQGDATAQRRGRGNGRDDRDIIIDGDDNIVIVWPGYGYGGSYPPFLWVHSDGWRYPVRNYPVYGYPGYGYPGYGSPGYGYPGYGNPGYGYPGGGYVGYPSYGGQLPIQIYGPGTYSSGQQSTVNGGFGGFSLGTGGVNVTLGGGRQRVDSRSTTTVMPGTTIVTTAPQSPFVMPRNNAPLLSPFAMPNRGAMPSNQPRVNFGSRGSRGSF